MQGLIAETPRRPPSARSFDTQLQRKLGVLSGDGDRVYLFECAQRRAVPEIETRQREGLGEIIAATRVELRSMVRKILLAGISLVGP